MNFIEGFSKLSKAEKIKWLTHHYTSDASKAEKLLRSYWHENEVTQKIHDEFIENSLSNYYLPYAIAPNFLINNKWMAIPMVIEESSVVAAAGKAAKFWSTRGGFTAEVLETEKVGHVHFMYYGEASKLYELFEMHHQSFYTDAKDITASMEKRDGGITSIVLKNKTAELEGYYQLHCTFDTKDAMGANFINSCLEQFSQTLNRITHTHPDFQDNNRVEVIMSILSNYVPNCVVRAMVSCPISHDKSEATVSRAFAERFVQAIKIAEVEPYRAVTHNKGIMNGIDAVILATGNDFRAVEAGVHAFASKDLSYTSLTHAKIENNTFYFWLDVPLALGTVGGLTRLHPLVKLSLEILQNPSAQDLMQITAVAGLAQNFAAIRSLVTTGIQKGHMKMHLLNLLNQLGATEEEKDKLVVYFKDNTVTNASVKKALENLRY